MSDTVKIKITVETGFAGATHTDYDEVDREDWDAMTKDEQEEYLDQAATDLRDNYVSCNAYVME
jgi:nitrogen regulatory protein PII-like uncharacterized protein